MTEQKKSSAIEKLAELQSIAEKECFPYWTDEDRCYEVAQALPAISEFCAEQQKMIEELEEQIEALSGTIESQKQTQDALTKKLKEIKCSVIGCENPKNSLQDGLCHMHYHRLRKRGDVGIAGKERESIAFDETCEHDPKYAKGLCSRCYMRLAQRKYRASPPSHE